MLLQHGSIASLLLGECVNPSFPRSLHCTHGCYVLPLGRRGSSGSLHCLHWCCGEGSLFTAGQWWKFWPSTLPPLTSSWRGYWGTLLKLTETGSLGFLLDLVGISGGCITIFSVVFGWSRAIIVWKISVSTVFLVLLLEKRLLLGLYFCLCLLAFPACQFLELHVWDIWGKRKSRGYIHKYMYVKVLASLSSFWVLYLFKYNTQCSHLNLEQRIGISMTRSLNTILLIAF